MLIDLALYDPNKEFIQDWFLNQESLTIGEASSLIAVATHVPVIACLFYIGEVTNWPKEVLDDIEKFIEFYNYKEIIGIPSNYTGRKL